MLWILLDLKEKFRELTVFIFNSQMCLNGAVVKVLASFFGSPSWRGSILNQREV